MLYPHQLTETEEGLNIYVPDPERVKPVYEQLLARDPSTKIPFWARIWPSARAMVSFIKSNPGWIINKQVLELGAGIGLPSFVAAPLASGVLISDYDPEAILLAQKNIEYLGLKQVQAMQIDWNHFPDQIKADTILLSDINYAPDQFNSVQTLIRKILDQGSTILLSTPQRITASPFVSALEPYIRHSVLEMMPERGLPVEIRILVLENPLT
ncbi:MAG: methyltransferase domain-containing protein [Sediminibacterium sp.]|nr:methyltransferase domain-containing protein [Sediminibacterium sp.]